MVKILLTMFEQYYIISAKLLNHITLGTGTEKQVEVNQAWG